VRGGSDTKEREKSKLEWVKEWGLSNLQKQAPKVEWKKEKKFFSLSWKIGQNFKLKMRQKRLNCNSVCFADKTEILCWPHFCPLQIKFLHVQIVSNRQDVAIGAMTFRHLDISSTWHFISLTFHQLDISSTWHFINLTFNQLDISSTWHFNNK